MDYKNIELKLSEMENEMDVLSRDTEEWHNISEAYRNFILHDISLRDLSFILEHLEHESTNTDLAKVMAAAKHGESVVDAVDMLPDAKLAFELRRLRREHGLTQTNVADAVGVTQAQIARFESGESAMTVQMMYKLFTYLTGVKPKIVIA
jgi:DNA-binding XRE family transcriptional regulator